MKLTNRLQATADFIEKGSIVADIGTDHGYLPVYLIKNNIAKHVYASDINKGPLDAAVNQIRINRMEDSITPILSNGLEGLQGKSIDQIAIAGMGGVLIGEIIKNNFDIVVKAQSLVLQPMTGQEELRKYLLENGFEILDENLAKEQNRIYQIILARHTGLKNNSWKPIEYHIGKKLIEKKHPLLIFLLSKLEKKWKKILVECSNNDSQSAVGKIREAKQMIAEIEEVKKCL
ncbi:tRNA (adenine(22)-N(1))-methyltransferase [Alkalibacter saccharofermentans]|uniref:tRNA (Adenine22-N1)-methyltransferase n=1 Tax=Alkalibacter saccharofermentans DSM 14828 TaxID=1120975 RepID=A0A1M4Z2N4_9FIRM|nr:class I SAM-dependent methyltransferase [Alkalibacter saccharofermentans]SHF12329.1 tRNA (adenine22-N1)-methyltransferase [Alkalibacter saccharofermentans DSM 14828]